jgi:hypothetical protein
VITIRQGTNTVVITQEQMNMLSEQMKVRIPVLLTALSKEPKGEVMLMAIRTFISVTIGFIEAEAGRPIRTTPEYKQNKIVAVGTAVLQELFRRLDNSTIVFPENVNDQPVIQSGVIDTTLSETGKSTGTIAADSTNTQPAAISG